MSTTISLATATAPELDRLVDAIGLAEVRVDGEAPGVGMRMPIGVYRFHRDGVSTRTTDVTVGDDSVDVRMFSLASLQDIELAVRLVERCAAMLEIDMVDAEGVGAIRVDELGRCYDAAWADEQARSGVRVVRALIADGRGPLQMPGPRRSYCIGRRILGELDAAGPADTVHARLIEAMRVVQWLPVRTAGTFVTEHAGKEIKLAAWMGDEIVFPAVPYAVISLDRPGEEAEVFLIESARVPELAGARWRSIDEQQGHITAFGADWPAVVAAARPYAVRLT